MISCAFDYYRPDTLAEARDTFAQLDGQGHAPVYYAGGSEVLTMTRAGSIAPGAVIDIKRIPEMNGFGIVEGRLRIGGCATLSNISESGLWNLLGAVCGRIADHTNQCRITLAGNLMGTIIYREAVLPLLLAEAEVEIFGADGLRRTRLQDAFDGRMKLPKGDILVSAQVDQRVLELPYVHNKCVKDEKIDYPLVTVCGINRNGRIRLAFSGMLGYPFRSDAVDDAVNAPCQTPSAAAEQAAGCLPEAPLDNLAGSAAQRLFVFKNAVADAIERLGGQRR